MRSMPVVARVCSVRRGCPTWVEGRASTARVAGALPMRSAMLPCLLPAVNTSAVKGVGKRRISCASDKRPHEAPTTPDPRNIRHETGAEGANPLRGKLSYMMRQCTSTPFLRRQTNQPDKTSCAFLCRASVPKAPASGEEEEVSPE